MATIRPGEPSDLERLVELFLELADYGITHGERRPLRWAVDPTGVARARFSHALGNPTEHHVAVAVDEHGDVIGTCHTELMGDGHPCPAHVHTLILDEPFRGQGLGRALMDDAFAWCAEQGVDEVSLDTGVRNTRGRRFYERYGFEEATVLLIKKVDG
ncbi:MAG TPA: GNAT family N-acetyltransferase [Gemmatimonadaceae bacterium]|nr:GNAT family N-acetyltransferase [Gemmatimonadaceae bacterium]